uniref:Cadherin domain-containing protein n=1 Tax=Myripristis murdjan TaxID=586833 RepID=A0A667WY21_9TELE
MVLKIFFLLGILINAHLFLLCSDADVKRSCCTIFTPLNSVKSYKLSPNEHFSLDVQSGGEHSLSAELVLQKALDREKQPAIKLVLTAVDGGKPPKSGTLQLNINVLDANDNAPTFSKPLYKVRVSENAARGTVAIKLNATDLDEGMNSKLVYSFIKQGNIDPSDIFDINSETGEITVKGTLDYEDTLAYDIRVQAKDHGNPPRSAHAKLLIEITDINDNAPGISITSLITKVKEDAEMGTIVALVIVSDKDGGNNGITNCKLAGSVPFKLQSNYKNDYSLLVDGPLDRETTPHYNVTIVATDEGIPPLSSTSFIVVHVSDVNDNSPVFTEPVVNVYVKENSPTGANLYTIKAFDPDSDENAKVAYTLIDVYPRNILISSVLHINSETGEIVSLQSVNYEELKTLQFKVQATDSGVPPLSSNVTVNVFILDENDNSPGILAPYSEHGSVNSENIPYSAEAGYFVAKIRAVDADSGYNALLSYHISDPVKEDAEIGTVVALVTVNDKDGGKNGITNCKLIGSVPFKLKLNYKNYYSLLVDGPLDRESVSEYIISITATDEGTPPLSSTSVITVHISDVNDNAPRFLESLINVYLKENSPVGTIIHTMISFDPDLNENAKAIYSLIDSSPKHIQTVSMVNINSETGEIVSLQSFNYEELKTFQFKIQATDSGVPPLSSNVTVNVFILDENDNSPGILAPYSEHGSVNSENIPYSAEAGYFVAKIRAVDADSGYNALLSYHISEPMGSNLFRIGTSTGEIRTKRRMSDNDLKTHPLVVLVCDNGEPSLSATVSIDVVVVEGTADIQTEFRHVPMKEERFSGLNLYLLIAIVSVSVIFLLSLISLIAVKCHRTDDSFGRYGAPMITTHPDGSWSYSKSTQQYDVCFSSDTLKSDVVVFPAPFPPVDAELISINGGDTFNRTQTLPNKDKVCFAL